MQAPWLVTAFFLGAAFYGSPILVTAADSSSNNAVPTTIEVGDSSTLLSLLAVMYSASHCLDRVLKG